ncbi:transposase [Clostridiaceae bacterium HSG29]|nr:transposase [Clostridiaceae bacterium HSG29]
MEKRNANFSKEDKIRACESYLSNNGSYLSISKQLGCDKETLRRWVFKYMEHGSTVFDTSNHNRSYTKEFKQSTVNEYLDGNLSLSHLAAKYNIYTGMISNWVNKYYNGIENKKYNPKGEIYTMKSRKVDFEERLEIVKWVIANNMNYKEAAAKNGVKYALIYQWVQKYIKNGADALEIKKRGPKPKNIIDENTLSDVEKLKFEIEREKVLRKRAEFELEVLKKKEEFEKKLRFRK